MDAHTHTQFAAFNDDWKEVIDRALAENTWFVNVGTQKDTSARAAELAERYGGVYATVGLHPIHTDKSYHDPEEVGGSEGFTPTPVFLRARKQVWGFTSRGEEFDYKYYKKLALNPKVVAIGECGLDYFRINDEGLRIKEKQIEAFAQQIRLAREVKKPLMIHCREAFPDLIKILGENKKLLLPENPGIVHFFSGAAGEARYLLKMGFFFTFGGAVTFTRDYDNVIKIIPLDRILSETDAPYVTPAPHRGKRNEPSLVVYVVKKLAEIKGVSAEEMRERILENTENIFGIKLL